MLEHSEIMEMHDKAYSRGQVTRERAADDMVFAWVTQWDDQLLGDSQLQYRGEFNILRKAMRQIMSDLEELQVQIDFEPVSENYQAADLMDGLYRTTTRQNTSIEAFSNSKQESIVAGMGCWKLENIYDNGSSLQTIQRTPIYEAATHVFWDTNAKFKDKSDAKWCSILERYSEDGAMDLAEELTGERPASVESFAQPEESYVFPWVAEDKKVFVGEFYHIEEVDARIHVFKDLFGNPLEITDEEYESMEDQLIDMGFQYDHCADVKKNEVTRYIVSGAEILEAVRVPCEYIPVVVEYGERAMVEGEEHFEGIIRLGKDPQRLRNFQMSYLSDIVSRSPRRKPIFLAEQVQGFERMYEESGAENNFPYLLQNAADAAGAPLPLGAVGEMPEQPIPEALVASINLSREAVDDVANAGLPKTVAEPDLSGKAVHALQGRIDMQSMIYQTNHKHALRRDALIFASMASEVYDTPRRLTLTAPDGTRRHESTMQNVLDMSSMTMQTINDLTSEHFEVYAEIGTNYKTQKDETRSEIKEIMLSMSDADPMRSILMLEFLSMVDGGDFEGLRKFAKRELLKQGIREPQNEEELQFLQELQQQQQQPDAATLAAMAEMEKANAEHANAEVRMYDAQTKRAKVEIDANKAGVEIESLKEDVAAKRMSNMQNLADSLRPQTLGIQQ